MKQRTKEGRGGEGGTSGRSPEEKKKKAVSEERKEGGEDREINGKDMIVITESAKSIWKAADTSCGAVGTFAVGL